MPAPLRPALFTLDAFDNQPIQGFTNGDDWNGWACPLFDKANADRILALSNELAGRYPGGADELTYDPDKDAYVATNPDYLEPMIYSGQDELVLGGKTVRLYGIGTGWWCWEEQTQ